MIHKKQPLVDGGEGAVAVPPVLDDEDGLAPDQPLERCLVRRLDVHAHDSLSLAHIPAMERVRARGLIVVGEGGEQRRSARVPAGGRRPLHVDHGHAEPLEIEREALEPHVDHADLCAEEVADGRHREAGTSSKLVALPSPAMHAAARTAWAFEGSTHAPAASSRSICPGSPCGSAGVPTTVATTASPRPWAFASARAACTAGAMSPAGSAAAP